MKSCLSKDFKYTQSHETNVADTFKRIRKELKAKADAEAAKPKAPVVASIEHKRTA